MFTNKAEGQCFGLPVIKRMTEALGGTFTFKVKRVKEPLSQHAYTQKELNGKLVIRN
jgi:hypothetical protein